VSDSIAAVASRGSGETTIGGTFCRTVETVGNTWEP
jgi:hypothetical protein